MLAHEQKKIVSDYNHVTNLHKCAESNRKILNHVRVLKQIVKNAKMLTSVFLGQIFIINRKYNIINHLFLPFNITSFLATKVNKSILISSGRLITSYSCYNILGTFLDCG